MILTMWHSKLKVSFHVFLFHAKISLGFPTIENILNFYVTDPGIFYGFIQISQENCGQGLFDEM
jgi:hypothetical protein